MVKSPSFPLYTRDWLCSKTVRKLHSMPGRGVAAYINLLCESWMEDVPATLPTDLDELAIIAKISREELDIIWPILSVKFPSDGNGRLVNERLMTAWLAKEEWRTRTTRRRDNHKMSRVTNGKCPPGQSANVRALACKGKGKGKGKP